ncbi:cytochrome P450 2J6-like isoform X1 [Styela clava]
MDSLLLFLITTLCFLLYCAWLRKRPKRFPPGPLGLPLVGYAPFLGKNPAITYMNMKNKYGSIFSVRIGSKDWIVLNDYKSIYEAYVTQGHAFSGRPNVVILDVLSGHGNGMGFNDYGEMWKIQRAFLSKALRKLSAGKGRFESAIVEESRYLNETLYVEDGKATDPKIHIARAVSNIVMNISIGSRLPYDDERFIEIVTRLKDYFTDRIDGTLFGIMFFFPMLRYLPRFRTTFAKFSKSVGRIKEVIRQFVDEHKMTFDPENPRDVIDEFFIEAKKRPSESKIFDDVQVIHAVNELFQAGTETSSTLILWMILVLAHHPEYQRKIKKEISDNIGSSGTPSLKHKMSMPFTSAFIQETQRLYTITPLSMPRKTTTDVNIRGFNIPKNTPVMPNFWAVHNDPEIFEDPEKFRPERFIDSNHNFILSKHVVSFSVGPRNCMGEQLARKEVFLFLVAMLQQFRIESDPAHPLPPLEKGVYGVAYSPYDFKVRFIQR